MKELNNMLDCLKKHAEETFEYYAEKEKWEPQDVKCAKEAAELYDKVQTIQMNTGIWENINKGGEFSERSYGNSYGGSYGGSYGNSYGGSYGGSYGNSYGGSYANQSRNSYGNGNSYMRGRDANTGRFMSRDDMYHDGNMWDGGYSNRSSSRENRGGQSGGSGSGNSSSMHSVKDQAIQRLENLMDSAKSDYEREEIMNMIRTIENQPR